MPSVVIFRSFRIAKMVPSRGAGQASFDATFQMDSDDEFSGFYAKKRRVSGSSLLGNVYRYQLLANSVDEATTKLTSPDFENMDIASSDDETLIIDPNILDVVADLPPKNQWTEHLVEYPVIAFIDAANVNRFLNSTVM